MSDILLPSVALRVAFPAEAISIYAVPAPLCVSHCTPTIRDCIFDRIDLSPSVNGGTLVQWRVSPRFHAPSPWRFRLEASDNGVQWAVVAGPATEAVLLGDPRQWWFGAVDRPRWRVVLIDKNGVEYPSREVSLSFHTAQNRRVWRLAREALRQEAVFLQKTDAGQPGILLKRRISGTPCPSCLDPYREEPSDPRCSSCYGTGWLGGYHAPVPCVWAALRQENDGEDLEQNLMLGTVANVRAAGRFLSVPRLDAFDVWVQERSDLRWVVRRVQIAAAVQGIPLAYDAELRLAAMSDPIYAIPLF